MDANLLTQLSGSVNFLGISLTFNTVIWVLAAVLTGFAANKISNYLIERSIKNKGGDMHAVVTSKKISAYVIYSLTLVVIMGIFGLPLTALASAVGLIGLGVSFALKDMIANFISGLMILINRPFKIGDQITVGGESGTVKDIQIRATAVKTYDGRKVIVPNSTLYNDTVINNTAYDERRFEVVVGVGYDDDIEEAKELAIETLEEAEGVDAEPEPQVLVNELGGSSVDMKLRGWTKPSKANMVKSASEVTQIVKEKYDEAGIDIPYPIRTVYMNDGE
jgi:small-conductance mechanosensitive channel